MNLQELRKEWEKGLTVRAVLVHNDRSNYETVYVVLEGGEKLYHLHRYFSMGYAFGQNGVEWQVSADIQNERLDEVMAKLSETFTDLYNIAEKHGSFAPKIVA